MTSPKIHEVFETYDKVFQRLYSQPLSIKLSSGKHKLIINTGRRAAFAYWNIYFVVGFCCGGLTASIIVAALLQGDFVIPQWKIGVQFFFFMLCVSLPIIVSAALYYDDTSLCFWNYGVTLQEIPPPDPDYMGKSLQLLIKICVLSLMIIPFFIWFFQLDPLSILVLAYFTEIYTSLPSALKVMFDIIRILGVFQVAYQVLTTFILIIIICCVAVRVFTNAIQALESQRNTLVFLRRFNLYRYLLAIIDESSGLALWSLSTLAFIMTVINTFATLKLYAVIPMPLYLVAPLVMIIAPVFAFSTIFPVVYIHEASVDLLHSHKKRLPLYNFSYLKRKYLLMRIRETCPLTFFAGILDFKFFKFKRSLKKSYLEITLYFTITFILSVPIDSLISNHPHVLV